MPPEHRPASRPATKRRLTKTAVRPTTPTEPLDQADVDSRFAALVRSGVLDEVDPSGSGPTTPAPIWRAEPSEVRLSDVRGLRSAKRALGRRIRTALTGQGGWSARSSHVLLYGPGGCGKSLLARAVAGELGAGFVGLNAADLNGAATGTGTGRVGLDADVEKLAWTSLFDLAGHTGSMIIFIDHAELLTRGQADRLRSEIKALAIRPCPVMIILATERMAELDPSLHAEPAFSDPIFVGAPGRAARAAIFGSHLHGRIGVSVSLKQLARCTAGLSGADIASICDRAAEEAALDGLAAGVPFVIEMADLAAQNAQTVRSIAQWRVEQREAVLRLMAARSANGAGGRR